MDQSSLRPRRVRAIFIAISALLAVQVLWWTFVFVRNVDETTALRLENYRLSEALGRSPEGRPEHFQDEAFHRRVMFISESIFFLAAAGMGFYLLFRTLKSEEKSREIQRNFIEVVSHESKTPLTALKLRLEAMTENWTSEPSLAEEAKLALAEVRRLASILEKALQLNRMEKYSFTFETLNLSEVVASALKRVEPFLKEKKISVSTQWDSDLWVKGDLFGLQSSIQSLIENSALYNTASERKLEISLEREFTKAIVNVRDNGPGVAPEERERIFERFFRGKAGKRVPGTGLGLYLARTVVQAHQGIVRLVSQNGPGAHFRIELPALRGEVG